MRVRQQRRNSRCMPASENGACGSRNRRWLICAATSPMMPTRNVPPRRSGPPPPDCAGSSSPVHPHAMSDTTRSAVATRQLTIRCSWLPRLQKVSRLRGFRRILASVTGRLQEGSPCPSTHLGSLADWLPWAVAFEEPMHCDRGCPVRRLDRAERGASSSGDRCRLATLRFDESGGLHVGGHERPATEPRRHQPHGCRGDHDDPDDQEADQITPTAANAGRGIPTGGIGAATTGHTSFHLMGEEPAITWRNRRRVLPIHDASSEEALNDRSKTSQIALD